MNIKKTIRTSICVLGALTAMNTTGAFAGGVAHHSGQAVVNSGQAVAHSAVAVTKTALTVTAVPFVAIGKLGGLSEQAGDALYDAAEKPLEIGATPVAAGPSPDRMIAKEIAQ